MTNDKIADNNAKSSQEKATTPAEKRNFFRVNQDVIFDFKPVDKYAADNDEVELEFEDNTGMVLFNELKRLDKDCIQSLRVLSEKNRLLGDYLQTLNAKIDLIAKHSLFMSDEATKNKPKSRINLSEDGLAFMTDRTLYKGSFIAIRLIFLPSYTPITCFAKVLRCAPKDNENHVAVKFHRISTANQQELSKHILKAQVKEKKASAKKAAPK